MKWVTELLTTALPLYEALYTGYRSLGGERHGLHPSAILKELGQ